MENNNVLEYKKQDLFFTKYFEYKGKAAELLAFANYEKVKLVPCIQAYILLVNFTSNYIDKPNELRAELRDLLHNKGNYEDIISRLDKIQDRLNIDHEKNEIIPKKQKVDSMTKDFWKEEQNLILKQIKKAGVDILCRVD